MLSYIFYKNLHLIGVLMVFVALGGLMLHQINAAPRENTWRRPVAITHGIGLLLVLVAGFGMLARLGIFWPMPGWAIAKIVIWLLLGAVVAVLGRAPSLAKPLWWIIIGLGALAAFLCLNKPF
jgi:hypothetical protein